MLFQAGIATATSVAEEGDKDKLKEDLCLAAYVLL
jgi:hypothetical protein